MVSAMHDIRLIDANAIIEKLQNYYETLSPDIYSEMIRRDEVSSCIAELINASTIETQPVKRGKWKCVNDDEGIWMCSNCGNEISLEVGNPAEFEWFFCPYCGANMDGKRKE